ncbi:MAG: putative manganese-dependent inorganic diphosphatase [Vallitaleaceae bacterium]|nr:putative manganese-dependent inorganic diphosphatase [Vallitaleaceae bacterium]
MPDRVYVFGHQNPDTDSVCSAISYSYLKNQLDSERFYEPVMLKEVNNETHFVLDYFRISEPRIIKSLKPQVSDINFNACDMVYENDSIKKALEIITNQTGRSLPVVDHKDRLIGVVSISDLVPRLLGTSGKEALKNTKTPLGNIIESVKLKPLMEVDLVKEIFDGSIYVAADLLSDEILSEQDLLICNQEEWSVYYGTVKYILISQIDHEAALHKMKEMLFDLQKKDADKEVKTAVFTTSLCMFEMIRGLSQTTPIAGAVKKNGLEYFVTYETIDDVKENMLSSKFRRFPVVDELGKIVGMISRSDLVDIRKKKAILVDHNERGQSISGIEDIEILEIIDHHRVADVTTMAPLYFRVEPVGCTCSIIARIFEEQGIAIPKELAGIMLSAIISDTLLFHSPTCTPYDKEIAKKLADIAGVDINSYGMKMIKAGSNIQEQAPDRIMNMDRKKFTFGKYRVSISQINTGDFDGFFKIYQDTVLEMERMVEEENYHLVVLLVTDVVIGGTEVIVAGAEKWIAESAFGIGQNDRSIFLPGVFSRKKQIVPVLMNAAQL